MVRFDHWKKGKSSFEPAKIWSAIRETDCTLLAIQTSRNDWGLNSDYPAFSKTLQDFSAQYENCTALGFSMGGYMALLFAHALNLRKAVLVSPQYSIQHSKVPFETRYWKESKSIEARYDSFKAEYAPKVRGALLYDPMNKQDREHKNLICSEFVNIRGVPLVHGGHPATKIIHQDGKWGRFVRTIKSEENLPFEFRKIHNKARRTSAQYQAGLETYLEKRSTR